jgi:hypothetical protein
MDIHMRWMNLFSVSQDTRDRERERDKVDPREQKPLLHYSK